MTSIAFHAFTTVVVLNLDYDNNNVIIAPGPVSAMRPSSVGVSNIMQKYDMPTVVPVGTASIECSLVNRLRCLPDKLADCD